MNKIISDWNVSYNEKQEKKYLSDQIYKMIRI